MEKIDMSKEGRNQQQERKLLQNIEILANDLEQKEISILRQAPMAQYTSFKTGGKAALLAIAENIEQLRLLLSRIEERGLPSVILGNGSNTLFRDTGYPGVVVKLAGEFEKIQVEGQRIKAGAAALLSSVAREALRENLTGLEFASGIP